ncbi:MAG: hypothetical protein ACJ79H_10010 [Myxococcales bacterium]
MLVVLLLAFVFLRRTDQPDAGPDPQWQPSDPLVPMARADFPGAPPPQAPNANNTGSLDCAHNPEACQRWSCAQLDAGLKQQTAETSTALGAVGGATGAAVGALWGGLVGGVTHLFGRASCEGSPTYEFTNDGASRSDLVILTNAELDKKYSGKRSGTVHTITPPTRRRK